MDKTSGTIAGIFITVFTLFAITVFLFLPFAVIWAANTLFGTTIQYTVWTWLAALVILSTARAIVINNGRFYIA